MSDPALRPVRVDFAPIRAVCIDLDGTLLDTIPDLAAAANRMLVDVGLVPLDAAQVGRFVGKGAEVLIARSLAAAGRPEAAGSPFYALARDRFFDNYRALNGLASVVYEGVPEGLASLRGQGLALACVTNKPVEFVGPLFERFDLARHFDFTIGGDSLPVRKPHPGPFLEACRRWSLAPSQVLAVGDSANDALAARAAGLPVLLVPYGYNEGEPVASVDADGIVSSLSELARLLQGRHVRLR